MARKTKDETPAESSLHKLPAAELARRKLVAEVEHLTRPTPRPPLLAGVQLPLTLLSTVISVALSLAVFQREKTAQEQASVVNDRVALRARQQVVEQYIEWASEESGAGTRRAAGAMALGESWGAGMEPMVASTLAVLLLAPEMPVRVAAAEALGRAIHGSATERCWCDEARAKRRRLLYGDYATGQLGVVPLAQWQLRRARLKEALAEEGQAKWFRDERCMRDSPGDSFYLDREELRACKSWIEGSASSDGFVGYSHDIAEAVRKNWECLEGAHLSGMWLVNAPLYGACMARTGLKDSNLCGADLREADLTGADLTQVSSIALANIHGAKLSPEMRALALSCGAVDMPPERFAHWRRAGLQLPRDWARWARTGFLVASEGTPDEGERGD
jgi:hypothetical protein